MARASHKTAPHTRTARVSPRPLHGTPPERAHQITPPLHDQGACTSGSVVSQLGRLWGGVRGGVGACGVFGSGSGAVINLASTLPIGQSNTPQRPDPPPRTPPSNLPHGTGYRTARGTARHGVRERPVTRDRVGGRVAVGAWCVAGGARPCPRHLVWCVMRCGWCAPVHSTRAWWCEPVHSTSRVVRARALDTWCAPVHSTPGARACTRHLVRARALDTWCAPVHSTPGARPCTRHLVRARALDTSPAHWRCGHPSSIT